jgi:hypothetical protein
VVDKYFNFCRTNVLPNEENYQYTIDLQFVMGICLGKFLSRNGQELYVFGHPNSLGLSEIVHMTPKLGLPVS